MHRSTGRLKLILTALALCAALLFAGCAELADIVNALEAYQYAEQAAPTPTLVPLPLIEQSDATPLPKATPAPEAAQEQAEAIDERGEYTERDDVALYIHTYGRLPDNFISKSDARKKGWEGGSLEPYAPGKCIGGDKFGNYEGLLPKAKGRTYTECDIGTLGRSSRGAKRIVFSNDGLIYYTSDHYESFELLYGEE